MMMISKARVLVGGAELIYLCCSRWYYILRRIQQQYTAVVAASCETAVYLLPGVFDFVYVCIEDYCVWLSLLCHKQHFVVVV